MMDIIGGSVGWESHSYEPPLSSPHMTQQLLNQKQKELFIQLYSAPIGCCYMIVSHCRPIRQL